MSASRGPEHFRPAPERWPELVPGEIHVWSIPIDREQRPELGHLRPEERERAERFRFELHRQRFGAARAAMRELLGGYLGLSPAAVSLEYGSKGKPFLPAHRELEFNLSHSGDRALLALARGEELGVDLELMGPLEDHMSVARRTFSTAEFAALGSLPPAQRLAGFYTCWTRKEAYVKATGAGIGAPLERFVVSLGPEEEARFVHFDDGDEARAGWRLFDLRPVPGYAGALAIRGDRWSLRCWSFEWASLPSRAG